MIPKSQFFIFPKLNMSQFPAISGKSNYVSSRSNRLVVFDPALLAFLLNNKTYRPIIEATRSVKGQQLFVPYIHDIITGKKLSLLKVYPKGCEWTSSTDYSGKEIFEFRPTDDYQRAFQASWVEINRIFTSEMLRMQSTVLNGRVAEEFIMVEKDKISVMSDAVKSKSSTTYDAEKDFRTASLNMVYFMERETEAPCVGIKFQESFPIDPTYKVASKRKVEKLEEEDKKVEA